jgi:hypothetical protein
MNTLTVAQITNFDPSSTDGGINADGAGAIATLWSFGVWAVALVIIASTAFKVMNHVRVNGGGAMKVIKPRAGVLILWLMLFGGSGNNWFSGAQWIANLGIAIVKGLAGVIPAL